METNKKEVLDKLQELIYEWTGIWMIPEVEGKFLEEIHTFCVTHPIVNL